MQFNCNNIINLNFFLYLKLSIQKRITEHILQPETSSTRTLPYNFQVAFRASLSNKIANDIIRLGYVKKAT